MGGKGSEVQVLFYIFSDCIRRDELISRLNCSSFKLMLRCQFFLGAFMRASRCVVMQWFYAMCNRT